MRALGASIFGAGLLVAAGTWAGASTYPVVPPSGGGGAGGGITQAQADALYLQQSGGTVAGNQTITGNLTLAGASSKLILGGTADGTDIQSADWQPIKVDLRSNTSELDIIGGSGLFVDCSSGVYCYSRVRGDPEGRGLMVESATANLQTNFSPAPDGTALSLYVGNNGFTEGRNFIIDPLGYAGTHVIIGTATDNGAELQVAGNSTGAIRAQYDSGSTTPPPGLHLINATASASQYAPTVLFEGSNGRCHRLAQQGIDLVVQAKNAPCSSGSWVTIAYLSSSGITTTLTSYLDGQIVNDSASNGGALFLNDDVTLAGRLNLGAAKTSAPSCAADADVGVVTKYSKSSGATISLCTCTKLGGTYTLTALGTGDCT